MALQQRMRVHFEDVFPAGAYMVGEVEPAEDFDKIREAREAGRETGGVQVRDKVNDKRVWQVRVVDADPEARKGQTELTVKLYCVVGVPFTVPEPTLVTEVAACR